jgi:ribose transport system permease protein
MMRARARAAELGYAAPISAIVLVLLVATVVIQPSFVSQQNWAPTLDGAAVVIILSMAQAVAVISGRGGIDLSVGPLAGLVNGVIVIELAGHSSVPEVIAVALGIGVVSGLINGALVSFVRLPAVVVTLGTYIIYQGLTLEVVPTPGGVAPTWISHLSRDVGPIPGMWVLIAAVVFLWVVITSTAFRRNLFAIGSDERAAYTAGVPVAATRLAAYCIAGVFAAVGGLAVTALLGSADPTVAPVYTLESVAAVALGGVALTGGRGGVVGAALGGAALFLINNLLNLAHVSVDLTDAAYGVILLAAVAANTSFMKPGGGNHDSTRFFRRPRIRLATSAMSGTERPPLPPSSEPASPPSPPSGTGWR